MMPGVSGFDILAAVRADEELKYMPVIVLTAASDPANKLKALDLGATEFLSKPVDSSELTLRVRNSLAFKAYQDHLAYSDTVTGLPNRRIFVRKIAGTIQRAAIDEKTFALLHVNIDRFKQINDSLGYAAGDQVLRAIAERLTDCVRGSDSIARTTDREGVVARTGGNEFTILLSELASAHNSEIVARRILRAASEPMVVAERELFLTASIGIAVYPERRRATPRRC